MIIRILSLLSIILINFLLISKANCDENRNAAIFKAINYGQWNQAERIASELKDPVLKKIVLSEKHLDSQNTDSTFEEIIRFIRANPHWPQNYLLKLKAENNLNAYTNKDKITSWFTRNAPLTGRGHKFYALAVSEKIKDKNKLKKIIKKAWHHGDFKRREQKAFYKKFQNYLTHADHVKKIDNHLWRGEVTKAEEILYIVTKGYQQSFKAQIALINGKKDGENLFNKIPAKFYTPGLVHKYLYARRASLPSSAMVVKLTNLIKDDIFRADDFWKVQSYIAREYIYNKRYQDAYNVTSTHFTKSSALKSEAEFLSGWLALRYLGKPRLALSHFRSLNKIVSMPVSKGRAFYWMARTYEKLKDLESANRLYKSAAKKYPFTFYGQLAASEVKQKTLVMPKVLDIHNYKVINPSSSNFAELLTAVGVVSLHGSNELARAYITLAVKNSSGVEDIMNLAQQLLNNNNIHHNAWMGKYAMHKNIIVQDFAYPVPFNIKTPAVEKPLIFAIMKQESVFEQHAISYANAYGFMQIIKETACEMSSILSKPCSVKKLTQDPQYNIAIGSNYLKQLLKQYNGSYILAIASYNAGPTPINRWIENFGDPRKMRFKWQVIDWLEKIPYGETRNYVQRVLENIQIYDMIINKNSKVRIDRDIMRKNKKL